MKINAALISSSFCILLLCGFGFGYKPVKLYEGTKRADTETTALIHGFSTEYQGESWLAMLVGVDGKMCPAQAMTGDNGPTPKNLCGNISVVLPGEHVFIYALQTANKIGSGPNNSTTNSWKRLDYFISTKIVVEPGTIYAAKPVHDNDEWTVSLLKACKSKNFKHDAQWFISRRTCS